MKYFLRLALIGLITLSVCAVSGQDAPKIKSVPPSPTSPASGLEMYKAYCAVCHGVDGKGKGPAVAALKVPPSDLTTLSARNGGRFPELRVYGMIGGETEVAAHGSKDMPIWGSVFRSMSRGSSAEPNLRVRNLTKYVETLQGK